MYINLENGYWKRKFDDDRRCRLEEEIKMEEEITKEILNKYINIDKKKLNTRNINKHESLNNKQIEFLKKELNTYKQLYSDEKIKNELLFSELCNLKPQLTERNNQFSRIKKIIN